MSSGHSGGVKAAWQHNSLTIVFGVLLLVFVVGITMRFAAKPLVEARCSVT